MDELLLGIDIGTSACKAAAFALDGTVAAQSNADYPVHYPHSGWAEQDPRDWWVAVCRCICDMTKQGVDLERVKGIGVDGQSWSAIPIDAAGTVLGRTPIWFDTRAESVCTDLERRLNMQQVFALCGNPLKATYSLPKVLWLKKNQPEVYHNTRYFLQSNSYIAHCLTGVLSQDRSQGYGYHCYNMQTGEWDSAMAEEMGLDPKKLPPLFDCHEILGTVTQQAAEETGLPMGIPVVAGGLDAACGTLGAGVLHAGETQEQGGQAGGMSICTEQYRPVESLILSRHVVPERWLLQGGTVGGGGVMRWMEQEFGADARRNAEQNKTGTLFEMDRMAEQVPPGSDGVVFLPYLAGERSPIWDTRAKGLFYGLNFTNTSAHFFRAAMEGVAFSLQHNLKVAEEAGITAEELRAVGGAANSPLWMQIKADVTGKSIAVADTDTATTRGAAILAGVGTGIYQSFEEAVAQTVTVTRTYQPNPKNRAVYDRAYRTYRSLYENLKELMHQSGEETK